MIFFRGALISILQGYFRVERAPKSRKKNVFSNAKRFFFAPAAGQKRDFLVSLRVLARRRRAKKNGVQIAKNLRTLFIPPAQEPKGREGGLKNRISVDIEPNDCQSATGC